MYRTVLLATDGSDDALGAAERAVDLAARYGAKLWACYVIETRTAYDNAIVEPETVERALLEEGEGALAAVAELAATEGVPLEGAIRRGVPHEELLEHARQEGADVIVVGRQGRSSFRAVVLGSTTDALVRLSPMPVLVVGDPSEPADER